MTLGLTPIQYFSNLFVGYHTKPVENYACCKVFLSSCVVPLKGQKSINTYFGLRKDTLVGHTKATDRPHAAHIAPAGV
jgi:hypothetical protein